MTKDDAAGGQGVLVGLLSSDTMMSMDVLTVENTDGQAFRQGRKLLTRGCPIGDCQRFAQAEIMSSAQGYLELIVTFGGG